MTTDLETLLEQVRRDVAEGTLDAWAWSTVVDEHAGVAVVDEPTFAALHDEAGIAATFPVGHAGLLHVYGYWTSTIATPYGRKRDRWQDGELAAALGLERDALHLDHDAPTTLLQRVTAATLPLLRDPPVGATVVDQTVGGLATRVVAHRAHGAIATAVILGVDDGAGLRLVTTFPTSDPRALLDEVVAAPRLRWNAVPAPGL